MTPNMESLQGHLLVASTALRDPNFFHAVVLLVRHSDEGAMGVILNRPLEVRLRQVWKQVADVECRRNDLIHLGGPCEGPLMAVHDNPVLGESEAPAGVYFCTDRGSLEQLAADMECQVRFFAGFSGWGPGQLEGELAEGSWLTLPAAAAHVFAAEVDLWDRVTREISGRKILDALGIREVPPDLRAN